MSTPRLIQRLPQRLCSAGPMLLAIFLSIPAAQAQSQVQGYANLPVVKPIVSCTALAKADLSRVADRPATIQSTEVIDTAKGQFCKVLGTVEPSVSFEVDLPVSNWTQRYYQGGCGGLCGMLSVGITNASSCAPALNGEFVVAGNDMGHQAQMGSAGEAEFARDPQLRIDFAYRGNHVTAQVAKALIKAYYGQAPRYSYFMGCSDGGREALMEAQRYPDDFDGISAGDPAAMFQVQNSFYHAWNLMANKRADGSNILMPAKRKLVHDAVVAHCDTLSGVKDGLLQDPRACSFKPATLQCAAGAKDTAQCLTAEEVAVVQKLYDGATDGKGNIYSFGVQRGSEAQLALPNDDKGTSMSEGMASRSVSMVILPEVSPADADVSKFAFTAANYERMAQLAPLYNALNTNLKPFAARGGKLILWHGWSDTGITPGVSIAYYQGVQKFMGATATDKFMRLFLLPGVGHCGGGDGYDQVDLLSPLMAWTEMQQTPAALIAGKTAARQQMGPPGGEAPMAGGAPAAGNMGAASAATVMAAAQGGGMGPRSSPVASAAPPLLATRPVYAYPYIPRYTGKGDPKDAANYEQVKSPVKLPQVFSSALEKLIGPNNQKNYTVKNGKLVAASAQ